ncbi:MAG TPA: hypothetical protein DCQ90_06450 [Erysipelotrichaceae bacterium]|nr:hypothetical protein [Erysipelotrichaceae bacterium]
MTQTIQVDELALELAFQLESYSQDVADVCKLEVDKVAAEVNAEIKAHVTFEEPTGKYVKAFRIKTTEDTKFNKTNVWHVAKPHYRLTHLLENGHALRNGGRSKAFPHIAYGEILAKKRLVQLMKGAIENLNR